MADGWHAPRVSILVFVEFAQRRRGSRHRGALGDGFQSLFLWNSLNGPASADAPSPSASVSILVFVEFAQRPGSRYAPSDRSHEVSILVFVEFAQRPLEPLARRIDLHRGFNPCFCGIRSTAPARVRGDRPCHAGFNPCFCGIRSTARTSASRSQSTRRVSILVFVEFAQRRQIGHPVGDLGSVSILVFVEFAQRLRDQTRTAEPVSILVFVEFAQRPRARRPLHAEVSILVFVEFAQRRAVGRRAVIRISQCFNPCFCGIRSTAIADRGQRTPGSRFQSLFLWNSLNGAAYRPCWRRLPTMFQSLFLWNSLNGADPRPCAADADMSFNPCFCGIRSTASSAADAPAQADAEFQSLFLWNSLNGDSARTDRHRDDRGFNPCFCGIRSTAACRRPTAPSTIGGFNPCFCGIRSTARSSHR